MTTRLIRWTLVSCLLLFKCWETHALKRGAPTWRPQSATTDGLVRHLDRDLLRELRGGYYNQNQPIEVNPDYVDYKPPPPGGAMDDHEEWLRQQQNQANSQPKNGFQSFQPQQRMNRNSMVDDVKQYIMAVHDASPCVAWTAFSCIVTFILFQIPSLRPSLIPTFVCSRSSIMRTAGISLILSAVSHISLYHLLGNLLTLLNIAPGVARNVTTPLWPLFLGSAVCSNILFTGLRRHGSCIGLSGVTMSIIAVQARATPMKVYHFLLAGILPVKLQAKNMLYFLLGVSFLGSFIHDSKISHLTHLGGLIFGILYYDLHVKKYRRFSSRFTWSTV